ncbi:MAG: hemerythrin family protein [Bacteroidales bacterium]|nr:hemerythrin family protein [Bacteroidales bacterium]
MEKLLEWTESLSTGYESLDDEHKEIFELINELYRAIKSADLKDNIESIVDKMVEYTETHFKDEEELFEIYNYEFKENHKLAHKKFVRKSYEFKRDVSKNSTLVAIQTLNFLRTWWRNHIVSMDRMYMGKLG